MDPNHRADIPFDAGAPKPSSHQRTCMDIHSNPLLLKGAERCAVLPFHPSLLYRKETVLVAGKKVPKSLWEVIVEVLSQPIPDPAALVKAIEIMQLTPFEYAQERLMGITLFFQRFCSPEETTEFFKYILPGMQSLVLAMPQLVPAQLPLLIAGVEASVTLSKYAVSSIVAGAFFCILPLQHFEKQFFPRCSFMAIFESAARHGQLYPHMAAKLKCHINYFRHVTKKTPVGYLTFHRKVITGPVDWAKSKLPLLQMHVHPEGSIEDAEDAIHADFANKFIGGGALETGIVQEEIMFTVQPELVASMLLCAVMEPHESILMIGSEQYSNFKGYAGRFEFVGDFKPPKKLKRDSGGRKKKYIAAIDALDFRMRDSNEQYSHDAMLREIVKAYAGFSCTPSEPQTDSLAISTGNWGGGAFLGNRPLKAILQWMAASAAGRVIHYYSFGEKDVTEPLRQVVDALLKAKFSVGDTWLALKNWNRASFPNLFQYLEELASHKSQAYMRY